MRQENNFKYPIGTTYILGLSLLSQSGKDESLKPNENNDPPLKPLIKTWVVSAVKTGILLDALRYEATHFRADLSNSSQMYMNVYHSWCRVRQSNYKTAKTNFSDLRRQCKLHRTVFKRHFVVGLGIFYGAEHCYENAHAFYKTTEKLMGQFFDRKNK